MEQENVDKLLTEVIESEGFINIDQSDINSLKDGVDSVDAIKVSGTNEQVGDLLIEAISSLRHANEGSSIKKMLFAIKLPIGNNFMMEDISKLHEALDMLAEDVECVWGLSTNAELEEGNLELIVVVGFVDSCEYGMG